MCKNYDSDFPASKVYDDIEANRTIYGGLYTWIQIVTPGFCPLFWHVPTLTEWTDLITYLLGPAVAGGHLKEDGILHWTLDFADNSSGFTALPGGLGYSLGFLGKGIIGDYWTQTPVDANYANYIQLENSKISLEIDPATKTITWLSVRLLKNFLFIISPFGVLTDYDGNVYVYVTIGTQQWIIQNLRTTHYADGTAIPNLTLAADWIAEDGTPGHDGAYCWYNNDYATYGSVYGALYNYWSVINAHGLVYFERSGIFDPGWRVPSLADFTTLETTVGGDITGGGKLKETGLAHWSAPNVGATDDYGFKGLPGGGRTNTGLFTWINDYGAHGSSELDVGLNWELRLLDFQLPRFSRMTSLRVFGWSIRCMRDVP
jgi:uncharacterized protein (TIGR02145 family)